MDLEPITGSIGHMGWANPELDLSPQPLMSEVTMHSTVTPPSISHNCLSRRASRRTMSKNIAVECYTEPRCF